MALRRAFEEIKTFILVTEQIDEAITVKVGEEGSPNMWRGKLAKLFRTIRAVALPPIKEIFCDQKNFGKSVLVEIVNDERINQVRVFRGSDFFVKDQFKRWIAFASPDRQVAGVDSFYRSEQFAVFLRAPVHQQIAFDRGPFGNVCIDYMSGKIKLALFRAVRGVGVELIVPELDLFQFPAFDLKLSDKTFPRGIVK